MGKEAKEIVNYDRRSMWSIKNHSRSLYSTMISFPFLDSQRQAALNASNMYGNSDLKRAKRRGKRGKGRFAIRRLNDIAAN